MIRVLLWDIDNTLLDFDYAEKESLRAEFLEFGLGDFSDEMLEVYMKLNRARWQKLERGEMDKKEVLEGRFRELFSLYGMDTRIACEFNDRYQELLGENVAFRDNSYELIKSLQGKYCLAIASNGTLKAQTGKLRNSGFDKLFDLFFISEQIGFEKPAKEFFDYAFEKINVWLKENEVNCTASGNKYNGLLRREEVLMIGDSLTSDIRGAVNYGIPVIWYNPKHVDNKSGVNPQFEIDNLSEVPKLL